MRQDRWISLTAVVVVAAFAGATPLAIASAAPERTERDRTPSRDFLSAYRRPHGIPFPAGNERSAARVELGRTLFFDPRLSGSRAISCASCHNPALAWSDARPRAIGHGNRQLERRTPTVENLAWTPELFWDGRAESLEAQALGPIAAPEEMNLPLPEVARRLQAIPGYAPLFARAYPGEPISAPTVARALATFERTLVSAPAPFDRWVAGDGRAISDEAKQGFRLFNTKAGCASCHSGWRLTDDSFHDVGVVGADRGRGAVIELESVQYAFKTPTLRDVARRAPYMHNGSESTLEAVIDLYDRGGRVRRPSVAAEVRPLGLTALEKRALVAFLRTLGSDAAPTVVPTLRR